MTKKIPGFKLIRCISDCSTDISYNIKVVTGLNIRQYCITKGYTYDLLKTNHFSYLKMLCRVENETVYIHRGDKHEWLEIHQTSWGKKYLPRVFSKLNPNMIEKLRELYIQTTTAAVTNFMYEFFEKGMHVNPR